MICPLLSRVEGLDELGSLQPDPSAGVPWIQGRFKVAAISWLRFTALKCSGRIQSTGSNVSIQSGWSSEFGRRPVDDQGQGLCYRLIPFVIRLILLWSGGAVGRFSRSSFFFLSFLIISLFIIFLFLHVFTHPASIFISFFFYPFGIIRWYWQRCRYQVSGRPVRQRWTLSPNHAPWPLSQTLKSIHDFVMGGGNRWPPGGGIGSWNQHGLRNPAEGESCVNLMKPSRSF